MFDTFLRLLILPAVLLVSSAPAFAEADGPDFFRISNVSADSALNIRSGPGTAFSVIGRIPADTDGIVNFGCISYLNAAQWAAATEEERAAARIKRFCRVGYDRIIGWSAGQYLKEGTGPDALKGGGRLSSLAGSEWLVRDFAAEPVKEEAWIAFKADDMVAGYSGCNRFNGKYERESGTIKFGPIAMTRMACPPAQSELETKFTSALGATHKIVATHLVLALFAEDNQLLATLTRRDAD
jgi:heat shock protein HslJ